MGVGDVVACASRPNIQRRVVNQTLDSKLMADFSLPVEIPVSIRETADERRVDFFGHPMHSAKMKGKQAASCLCQIEPDAIKKSARPEGDDVMSLIMRIGEDVFPEPRRIFAAPQGHVEIPAQRAILRDVVHHDEISQNSDLSRK